MAGTEECWAVLGTVLSCCPCGGCPAVPRELLGTQSCACCCLLWGLVLPAGCQLKLKHNQAQPELCQGTGSAGEERGKKGGWGLPRAPRACAAACPGWNMPGAQRFLGMLFVVSVGCLCQALTAAVWNSCPSPGTQLGFLL